jgi:hypothetical protein
MKCFYYFTSLLFRKQGHRPIDDKWRTLDRLSYREPIARKWLAGEGIEIGALHQPVILPDRVRVHYVDYKTKAENQTRYPELGEYSLVDTNIVDDGFILNKIADSSLDFIIANHALEHSPDPYGTLLRWKSKLRHRGLLYFALPIADKCYDRGRILTTLAHLVDDHCLFSTTDIHGILAVTKGHLREFLRISDANIRRQNHMDHIMDEQEIEQSCTDLMLVLTERIMQSNRTYNDLITAHVVGLNQVYDIHYHTFSPTSLSAFVSYFCDKEGGEVVELKKSGSDECIVLLLKDEGKPQGNIIVDDFTYYQVIVKGK